MSGIKFKKIHFVLKIYKTSGIKGSLYKHVQDWIGSYRSNEKKYLKSLIT